MMAHTVQMPSIYLISVIHYGLWRASFTAPAGLQGLMSCLSITLSSTPLITQKQSTILDQKIAVVLDASAVSFEPIYANVHHHTISFPHGSNLHYGNCELLTSLFCLCTRDMVKGQLLSLWEIKVCLQGCFDLVSIYSPTPPEKLVIGENSSSSETSFQQTKHLLCLSLNCLLHHATPYTGWNFRHDTFCITTGACGFYTLLISGGFRQKVIYKMSVRDCLTTGSAINLLRVL